MKDGKVAIDIHATSDSVLLQRACDCGGAADCECEEETLQRAAMGPGPSIAPLIVNEVLRSSGQPLDGATRSFMEDRFGHDFSAVRVHTDARAAASAHAVKAKAYTVGSHVAFGAGQYDTASTAGRKLLAHELAHTVQQRGKTPGSGELRVGEPHTAAESEANAMAEGAGG